MFLTICVACWSLVGVERQPIEMRTAPIVFVAAMAFAASVHSQVSDAVDSPEPAPVPLAAPLTARLLDSIPDGTPPPPAPPKPSFVVPAKDVISTKTVQQEGRIITIQRIKPIALPPPPAPAAPPTAEESAAAAQRAAAFRATHPRENFLQLGTSVYLSEKQPPRAFVRLWPQDGNEAISFWSNADFRLIAGLGRFADSAGQRHRLFLMWSVIHTDRTATLRAAHGLTYQPPAFPAFPGEDSSAPFDPAAVPGPATFVITGDAAATPAQLAAIDALHQVYNNERGRLHAAYQGREQVRIAREAELKANPPRPKDVTIRYWRTERPVPAKGGAK
jgi:hypothetical protein